MIVCLCIVSLAQTNLLRNFLRNIFQQKVSNHQSQGFLERSRHEQNKWKMYLHTEIVITPCFNIFLVNLFYFVSKFQYLRLVYGFKMGKMCEWLLNNLDLKTKHWILVMKSEDKQTTFGIGEKHGLEVGTRQKSALM